jgi:hypothetical protein
MISLLVANPQNTHKLLVFMLAICLFFFQVMLVVFLFSSMTKCCLGRSAHSLYTSMLCCENLSVFIDIVMAKGKCSINDSIKSENSFIKV